MAKKTSKKVKDPKISTVEPYPMLVTLWDPSAPVDLATARRMHEARGNAGIRDECNISKKIHKYPTRSWFANPGGSDVPGIDAPGQCRVLKSGKLQCTLPKNAKIPENCVMKKKKARSKKK